MSVTQFESWPSFLTWIWISAPSFVPRRHTSIRLKYAKESQCPFFLVFFLGKINTIRSLYLFIYSLLVLFWNISRIEYVYMNACRYAYMYMLVSTNI